MQCHASRYAHACSSQLSHIILMLLPFVPLLLQNFANFLDGSDCIGLDMVDRVLEGGPQIDDL